MDIPCLHTPMHAVRISAACVRAQVYARVYTHIYNMPIHRSPAYLKEVNMATDMDDLRASMVKVRVYRHACIDMRTAMCTDMRIG